jgi:hypothetical protein
MKSLNILVLATIIVTDEATEILGSLGWMKEDESELFSQRWWIISLLSKLGF